EDGIRDFHVTGVQTCALPICGNLGQGRRLALPGHPVTDEGKDGCAAGSEGGAHGVHLYSNSKYLSLNRTYPAQNTLLPVGKTVRSEERRVGKESRSRWVSGR